MESAAVDSYLIVLSEDGAEVASDDDGGNGLAARVAFGAPATGRYTILATTASAGETGEYTIRLEFGQREQESAEHRYEWLGLGAARGISGSGAQKE